MAHEKFSVIAIEETHNWDTGLLESIGIEAAFGLYLIRHGEATHICSFEPSSYCSFVRNEFVFDSENEVAHEFAGENMYTGNDSTGDYFGYMEPDKMDPRFIAETFKFRWAMEKSGTKEARRGKYLDQIWKAAEEAAHEADRNGLWADICNVSEYRRWQEEKATKRRAENRKPLQAAVDSGGNRGHR